MAVSSDGRYVLSCCQDPNVTYFTDLSYHDKTLILQPVASRTPMTIAAFHPDRAGIFLLGFRDGTMTAYNGSKIMASATSRHFMDQDICASCELGCLSRVHRAVVTTKGQCSVETFVGAAFLQQYKTRAITIGHDGRCRIISLRGPGRILRTWRPPSCPVAVALCSRPVGHGPGIITIALQDCSVSLYDYLGTLLMHHKVPGQLTRILKLEWVPGPVPCGKRMAATMTSSSASRLPSLPNKDAERSASRTQPRRHCAGCQRYRNGCSSGIRFPYRPHASRRRSKLPQDSSDSPRPQLSVSSSSKSSDAGTYQRRRITAQPRRDSRLDSAVRQPSKPRLPVGYNQLLLHRHPLASVRHPSAAVEPLRCKEHVDRTSGARPSHEIPDPTLSTSLPVSSPESEYVRAAATWVDEKADDIRTWLRQATSDLALTTSGPMPNSAAFDTRFDSAADCHARGPPRPLHKESTRTTATISRLDQDARAAAVSTISRRILNSARPYSVNAAASNVRNPWARLQRSKTYGEPRVSASRIDSPDV